MAGYGDVNLGSSAAVNPLPAARGVYAAAKAATQSLTRVAAAEWGPDGIRVVAVLPAATSPAARAWGRPTRPGAQHAEHPAAPGWAIRRRRSPGGGVPVQPGGPCDITGTTIAVDGGQAYLR